VSLKRAVTSWRATNRASIAETAAHFGVSVATVKPLLRLATSSPPGGVSHPA
jgi:DNA-directed RNA polymerase specialized sigma24 family protein